jgi:hypothetical protein
MKPAILATAERFPADCLQPRVLRFARCEASPEQPCRSSSTAQAMAWLLLIMVPLLIGRVVVAKLDEPLLGMVAAMLAIIPLMIALCPRQRG